MGSGKLSSPPAVPGVKTVSQTREKLSYWSRSQFGINCSTEITLILPDELAAESFGDPARIALEALAARAYEAGVFSVEQVRRMLDLPSRWEAQHLLTRHGVWPGITAEEIFRDAETAAPFSVEAR